MAPLSRPRSQRRTYPTHGFELNYWSKWHYAKRPCIGTVGPSTREEEDYLEAHDKLPFGDWADFTKNRGDADKRQESLKWV